MTSSRTSILARLVAEFAVVVLGVIVALGVDEWRQSRAHRVEEARYYERIAQDLVDDVAGWERLLGLLDEKERALTQVERWVAAGLPRDEGTLRALVDDLATAAVYSGSVPPQRRATYEELLSTGKLEVILDRGFRAALIDYHFAFANLVLRLSSRTSGYEGLAYALVPREVRGSSDNFARPDMQVAQIRSIAERASNHDLESVVIAERNRAAFLRGQFEELLLDARTLLAHAGDPPRNPADR
jgi:hypothetical protein